MGFFQARMGSACLFQALLLLPPKLTVELYFQCYNQLSMIILFFWFLFSFQSPHRISVMDQWHLPQGSEVSGHPWYTGRHVLLEKGNVFKSLRSQATKNKLMSLKLTSPSPPSFSKPKEKYLLSGSDMQEIRLINCV